MKFQQKSRKRFAKVDLALMKSKEQDSFFASEIDSLYLMLPEALSQV